MSGRGATGRKETVLVAGAGLGGALIAIYLARAGHRVRLFERRSDPRKLTGDRGRSINLAISTRGLAALRGVGVDGPVVEMAVPMRGRMMHGVEGRLTFQPYGTTGQAIHSVSRLGLNIALIDEAERHPEVVIEFDSRLVDVDPDGPELLLESPDGSTRRVAGDRLIGADGAYSAVRARLQRLDRFDYSQSYLEHGYKELTVPPADDGGFRLEPEALHIWPRGGFMMIALPNVDRSFTCTLFWPLEGATSFRQIDDAPGLRAFFGRWFPDAVPLMPRLAEDYFANPTSSLVTVRCHPWHHLDRVVLLGDACHAIVPFYGQGANAAFEDCVVLDRAIHQHAPDWGAAFAAYGRQRKPHVDVLADLALENFIEMRDRVASRSFLWQKRLEKGLHRAFPERFVPLYSMVTFSQLPYGDAVERARRQWRLVRRIAATAAAAALIAAGLVLGLIW
ncbi:MAG TPA: NAD(P)/FAD-dependent oxidoreductase [Candidatus Polarisedimenticolaceae bacterium]|nr:NAD(P)/FAD-dependent oxidoreductase [Candidatus Polarisedimenticolaceae bacterium]